MGDGRPAKRAILIAGPTASGKSALALSVAEAIAGTIINADAMQVYADLSILTARPSAAHMDRVPHRLFGHVDAAAPYSVGHWLDEVKAVLDETSASGRIPVLVGGTGLYIRALTEGLSAMPAIPEPIRARLRAEGLVTPPAELHARLAKLDPGMAARLRPTDPQRILRALEMFEATGTSLAVYQAMREPAVLPMDATAGVFLDVPRRELYARIDNRFDAMVRAGAVHEAAAIAARSLDPNSPPMRALGVAPLALAARGSTSIPDAVAKAKAATRQYAKRQITFARHQLPGLTWASPNSALRTLMDML